MTWFVTGPGWALATRPIPTLRSRTLTSVTPHLSRRVAVCILETPHSSAHHEALPRRRDQQLAPSRFCTLCPGRSDGADTPLPFRLCQVLSRIWRLPKISSILAYPKALTRPEGSARSEHQPLVKVADGVYYRPEPPTEPR